MKSKHLLESFNHAINGIVHALKHERNMRIHALFAALVLILAAVIGVDRVEFIVLILTIGLVLVAEMLNTALERAVDIKTQDYYPLAKTAKDVAAGAVLFAATTATVIGSLIFYSRLEQATHQMMMRLEATPSTAILVASLVIVLVSIAIKRLSPPFNLRGGFPSAHTAIAFALASTIYLSGATALVTFLSGAIALLVAQARVEAGFHSIVEVFAGAFLGVFVTILVFQLLVR